jgi:hypothetical protein
MNNYVLKNEKGTQKRFPFIIFLYPINKIITPVILLTRFKISPPQLTRDIDVRLCGDYTVYRYLCKG